MRRGARRAPGGGHAERPAGQAGRERGGTRRGPASPSCAQGLRGGGGGGDEGAVGRMRMGFGRLPRCLGGSGGGVGCRGGFWAAPRAGRTYLPVATTRPRARSPSHSLPSTTVTGFGVRPGGVGCHSPLLAHGAGHLSPVPSLCQARAKLAQLPGGVGDAVGGAHPSQSRWMRWGGGSCPKLAPHPSGAVRAPLSPAVTPGTCRLPASGRGSEAE